MLKRSADISFWQLSIDFDMDQTRIVHTVFLIAKIGSLFMCGYKAGLQQGDQGQQFCHYVSFLSGSQWSLACITCPRCYLTRISNICDAAHISLFWAPNRLNELPEMHFEICFNLIGELTVAFLKGQWWHAIKSWYTGGSALNKGFSNQKLVLSVVQAMWRIEYCLYSCLVLLKTPLWQMIVGVTMVVNVIMEALSPAQIDIIQVNYWTMYLLSY